MKYFVEKHSIVRQIWGKGDIILLIFAGASAEFALNKAVDWLYFTGKLPSDPLKRLFTTVSYAREIVFSEYDEAMSAIDKITNIHRGVESQRKMQIPDWAYRDVLYMLIDYSIRSFELLERKLSNSEKEEVFDTFYRMGSRMGIIDLPATFNDWRQLREAAIDENLVNGHFTMDLYQQYRKHLGWFRYFVLKQSQILLLPQKVNMLLGLGKSMIGITLLNLYKLSGHIHLQSVLKNIILPKDYKQEILALDV